MRLSLMPKKSFFFTQFDKHATNSLEAAVALERLLTDFTEVERKVRDIHAIEHYGDELTHEIFKSLNETFVTPLDREDIIGIASKLDDVADVAYDVSELIQLYKVRSVRPQAIRQAKALVGAATEMVAMMKALEGLKGLEPYWIKIHTYENEGDQVFRDAVGDLFANVTDPLEIIKWKDIHSLIEVAVDRCEDVANIVEMIVIKHSSRRTSLDNALVLLALVVVLGVIFEYVNGFHDAANAIATVVATRVLTPRQAVIMAGSLNLVGALSGVAVAKTVGSGIVDANVVTQDLVVAALVAAIAWDVLTWYFGLPSSSSHALIFSIIGASVAIHGPGVVVVGGLQKTSFGIVYSPAIAFLVGYLLMLGLYWALRNTSFGWVQRFFGKAQILSSAYMAFSHGGNDGQKTMGIIALALAAYGVVPTGADFYIPDWVKVVCAVAIGVGTMTGGWRIMHTMGTRITKLTPVQGFAAETTAGTVIEIATRFGIPISTTHAISGAILGVGSTRRLSAVRWGIAGRIVTAWVLTIPGCFVIGFAIALALRAIGVRP